LEKDDEETKENSEVDVTAIEPEKKIEQPTGPQCDNDYVPLEVAVAEKVDGSESVKEEGLLVSDRVDSTANTLVEEKKIIPDPFESCFFKESSEKFEIIPGVGCLLVGGWRGKLCRCSNCKVRYL